MNKVRNVLVFPAGTEIGLEIFNALKFCKETRLFGAGQAVSNHAEFVYPSYDDVPSVWEEGWLEGLIATCVKHDIDYIFPAHDDALVALSRVRERLPAVLIAPSEYVCEVTRSKSRTYKLLAEVVRVPRLFSGVDEVKNYPVFVKPDRGNGSIGARAVHDPETLRLALAERTDLVISEYLPGHEYTVDCFSDRERGLLFCGARIRDRTRNGIAVNTKTVVLPEARVLAESIGKKVSVYGPWFFQVKRSEDGALVLLEVAPRIAGSMAAHRVLGVNFPLLAIYEAERSSLQMLVNTGAVEVDRALGNRYRHSVHFDVLYIDLDDTILMSGRVSTEVISFVFDCLNASKRVVLVTRHEGDLGETLRKHRIADLFDRVIHVPRGVKKSSVICHVGAIFIDDSFSERLDVAAVCGINTFDPSMIELLSLGNLNE